MIILLHANYFSLGPPTQSDVALSPYSSFLRVFAEHFCIVSVNVFILISGWFGIKATLKGLCSLLYQVFFYGLIIVLIGLAMCVH